MIYKMIMVLGILLLGCSKKTTDKVMVTETSTVEAKVDDCFDGRVIVQTIEDIPVTVVSKMNRYYLVHEHTHYEPCEVPAEFAVEGKTCKISGDVLEIFPTERRAGTPIILKSIK